MSQGRHTLVSMDSENPTGDPDNQQGRLDAYLSGFADGEGTFSVGVSRRPDLSFGFQLVPEFRASQNSERASVLEIFQRRLGCGRIVENDQRWQRDRTMVLVVRRRRDLIEHVIPFFRRNPLLSEKRKSFELFEGIVLAMAAGRHRQWDGFVTLVQAAFAMNGDGRYRRWRIEDVIGMQNPQRLHARHALRKGVKIQSELHGDMQSQAEMT